MSSLTPTKGVLAPGESSSPTKDSLIKLFHVFYFWGAILTCLDPDSKCGSRSTDPFESGSSPDPKPVAQLVVYAAAQIFQC
jgi:hypothetical protein